MNAVTCSARPAGRASGCARTLVGALAALSLPAATAVAPAAPAAPGDALIRLLPPPASEDRFPTAVDLTAELIVVGCRYCDRSAEDDGAVHVHARGTGELLRVLVPNDPEPFEAFGSDASVSGGRVAVGAAFDGENGPMAGAASIFDLASGARLEKIPRPIRSRATVSAGTSPSVRPASSQAPRATTVRPSEAARPPSSTRRTAPSWRSCSPRSESRSVAADPPWSPSAASRT